MFGKWTTRKGLSLIVVNHFRHSLVLRALSNAWTWRGQGRGRLCCVLDVLHVQACLRDWLTTADLRLSVLVDAGAVAAQGCNGGGASARYTAGLVDGSLRAQLDPAHARRIVAITDKGFRAEGLPSIRARSHETVKWRTGRWPHPASLTRRTHSVWRS